MKFLFITAFVVMVMINAIFMAASLHSKELKLAAMFALGVTVSIYVLLKHWPGV